MVLLMHCLMALVMGLLIDEAQVKAVILNDAAAEEAAADAHHELAVLHMRAFRAIIPNRTLLPMHCIMALIWCFLLGEVQNGADVLRCCCSTKSRRGRPLCGNWQCCTRERSQKSSETPRYCSCTA